MPLPVKLNKNYLRVYLVLAGEEEVEEEEL